MAGDIKDRTLVYRRATWTPGNLGQETLENCLRQSLDQLQFVENTRISHDNGPTIELRHRYASKTAVLLHIAGYTPGENASIVPAVEGVADADIEVLPPPDIGDFMDGDLMMRVSGNHVVLCPSGIREASAINYLRALIDRAGFTEQSYGFELVKIANVNKTQLIAQQGVKAVRLDVALYDETLREMEHRTVRRTIQDSIVNEILALVGRDSSAEEIASAENLQARLIISFDRRRKGGALAREELMKFADNVAREEDEGFVIETFSGERISGAEISLRKPVKIEAFGKTVPHQAGWSELEKYFQELSRTGAIEQ